MSPRQRGLLAALAIRLGRVVPLSQLIDDIWADHGDPPASARQQVQNAIAAIRRLLLRRGVPGDALQTRGPGYALCLPTDQLDAAVFEATITQARAAMRAGDPVDAVRLYRRAESLWRGPAFAAVAIVAVRNEASRLDELRLAAWEECVDLELASGATAHLVPDLMGLAAQHPLRERLQGQLMVALHHTARRAEALEVFSRTRRLLAAELGLDPSPGLCDVARAVLTGDLPPSADPAVVAPRRPAQLPPDPPGFLDRESVAEELRAVSESAPAGVGEAAGADAPRLVTITGPVGSGKSVLAVRAARTLVDHLPDGQLYADFGNSPSSPRMLHQAVGALLVGLGVRPYDMPTATLQRLAEYRSLVAGRRVVVVLDNAVDEGQVRPLLPGTAAGTVVVTSRRRLAGLCGSRAVEVSPLDRPEAVELLARLAGRARVAAEPDAARALVDLCGRLPLPITLVAARLRASGHLPMATLVERLAPDQRRLSGLSYDDRDMRSTLTAACAHLPSPARTVLAVVAAAGQEVSAGDVARLTGVPVAQAAELLDLLYEAHLAVVRVDSSGCARYRLPELVRVFGRELPVDDSTGRASVAAG